MIRLFGLLIALILSEKAISQAIPEPFFEFEFPIKGFKEKGVSRVLFRELGRLYTYSLDEKGNIIHMYSSWHDTPYINETIANFRYDERGNMILNEWFERRIIKPEFQPKKDSRFNLRNRETRQLFYDSLGHLIKELEFSNTDIDSSLWTSKTTYEYDSLGNPVFKIKRPQGERGPVEKHRYAGDTTYIHRIFLVEPACETTWIEVKNKQGLVISLDARSPSSSDGKREGKLFKYEYSPTGVLLQESLQESLETGAYQYISTYQYDELGNMVCKVLGGYDIDTTGEKNEDGQLFKIYTYNEKGLLTGEYPGKDEKTPDLSQPHYTIEYEYW